jgi:hypothetical protein
MYNNTYETEAERNAYAQGFATYAENAGCENTEQLFDNVQARVAQNREAYGAVLEQAKTLQAESAATE